MNQPNEASTGQEIETHVETSSEVASSLFDDISNPAVEQAIAAEEPTSSVSEPVIPNAAELEKPTVVNAEEVQPPTDPQIPQAVQYTPEQIAQFQAWQAAQQQQIIPQQQLVQQPVQQPQQLKPEEIDKAINRYKVTPETFNKLFTEEDPGKASAILDDILQGAVKQAVTMSAILFRDETARLQQTVQPYMQFADSQREVMLREQFFTANPDLRGQDLVINTVMNELSVARANGQYRPTSEQQVFQDVATRTKALIASMQQQGQQVPTQQGMTRPQSVPQGKPKMVTLPTVSGGAGAGSAAGQSAAAVGESQAARSVFG